MKKYTAKELSDILQTEGDSEMTVRKIRYYRQIELLPPMQTINNKNYFTDEHLHFLRAMRTMQRTGETLTSIKQKLEESDEDTILEVGSKMMLYNSRSLLETNTHQFNSDISITFSKQVPLDKQAKIIQAVEDLIE